ncbi:hypothetical protein [Actinomyces capricornis]|uniref:Methylated-DNA-[protein]-cysteine S-methyltransferase DNA binding domain-containing protein n=1 Tax=Actinomyces capricornis TaxID=2755559 RepID=A0ABM7U6S3_9ACTO|nr:hypothetical protein [Actinomyces capricornis]BDA63261.1 hypothetical protein MANAM107_00950 [Actinomyces capricornis]
MPAEDQPAITVGARYPVGQRRIRLSDRVARILLQCRPILIDVATHGEVITYGELSEAIDGAVLPRHMGPLLHMIAHDCAARGEPSLAALVVRAGTWEVGTADTSWAAPERRACWEHWGSGE